MAYADYRLCDKCGEKAFYDEQLDYRPTSRQDPIELDERTKQIGQPTSYRLQRLGDWAVLCEECAKTHRTAILAVEPPLSKIPSGETLTQREEVCAAWADLPDDLRKDERLTRLYRALGGPHMDDPTDRAAAVSQEKP